jgi:hypothetical protein
MSVFKKMKKLNTKDLLNKADCQWILKVISLSKDHHGTDFEQAVQTIRKIQLIKEEKTPNEIQ